MEIRKTNPDDAEKLVVFLQSLAQENCETIPEVNFIPTIEEERKWLIANDGERGIVYVAISKNDVVGMINGSIPSKPEFNHTCEFGMSVLSSHRNQGLGSKLMQDFLKWSEKTNIEIVELNVFSNNLPALKLYKKYGFKVDGERIDVVKKGNRYLNLIHMSKRISA
ncbi:MAG: GNAT family N-acetyltransferase [Cyanobacteria bacterium P01_F01_bin.116]